MRAIGNTPLIKLERLPEPDCAEVFVKYEGGNPTGSMKDRMALSMIEGAERRGELKPGGRVVEYTGGSTGGALAMSVQQEVIRHTSYHPMLLLMKN
jgi:cysteine synthase A